MSQNQLHPRIRWRLFSTFFRIGLFTFGGGFAMLPLIEREVSVTHKWVETDELLDMIALAQSMPGPVAINSSIFIGRHLAGTSGALAAMLGCTLPSFLVILVIAISSAGFQDNKYVQFFFNGVLAAVTALILVTSINMAKKVIKDKITAGLALAAVILVAFLKVHALLAIIGGAAVGFLLHWLKPALNRKKDSQQKEGD